MRKNIVMMLGEMEEKLNGLLDETDLTDSELSEKMRVDNMRHMLGGTGISNMRVSTLLKLVDACGFSIELIFKRKGREVKIKRKKISRRHEPHRIRPTIIKRKALEVEDEE